MIGTVPVYDSVIHYQRDLSTLTARDFIEVVRLHAMDGVDFVTLHCGITRKTIDQIRRHKRKMNIVSRGGSLVFAWTKRRSAPIGAGLLLGGGLSNLYERLRHGKVYDYLRFPKAPGFIKDYVYNLADFAIFIGAILLVFCRKKR